MTREELLSILKQVSPALSIDGTVPSFCCFFFDGNTVTAYDDQIALEAPCSVDFIGGLKGSLLNSFLSACHAKKVSFSVKGESCVVKSGKSKLALGVLDPSDFLFSFPKTKKSNILVLTRDILACIKIACVSAGYDSSYPWRIGVTVRVSKNRATFFSSDNQSMTRCSLKLHGKHSDMEVILPPRFCELLLDNEADSQTLFVGKGWLVAVFESGARLFARSIPEVRIDKFEEVLATVDWRKGGFLEIPLVVEGCLDRALVVISGDKQYTNLFLKKDSLKFYTQGDIGEVEDLIMVTPPRTSTAKFSPRLWKKILPHVDEFKIVENKCIAFKAFGVRHMLAIVDY